MSRWLGVLVLFAAILVFATEAGVCMAGRQKEQGRDSLTVLQQIPSEAMYVYTFVLQNGTPPAGYVGGRVWYNRERRLPRSGNYREYDIHPKVKGRNRGPERLVIDWESKRGWYTYDHYRTFISIPRGDHER